MEMENTREYFAKDRMHLSQKGAEVYSQYIQKMFLAVLRD